MSTASRERRPGEVEDLSWPLLEFEVSIAWERPQAGWVYLVVFIPNMCPPVSLSVTVYFTM